MAMAMHRYVTACIAQWRRSRASLEATGCRHRASIMSDKLNQTWLRWYIQCFHCQNCRKRSRVDAKRPVAHVLKNWQFYKMCVHEYLKIGFIKRVSGTESLQRCFLYNVSLLNKLFKIGLFKTIFLQLPRCCALFPGFNTHYVSSIFQFNLRIFTKHVRGLLSSILNALHHDLIPCALAQFFATTHHIEHSSAHFSARALTLFKAAA